ncbi:MAG TPA: glycosyltransferase family 4 protein [Phycisphaerae bacterium]|nr:glycosyltransferase family 4 protein [Phycisphaerae bacterium]HRW52973.1 glycosyltransferase family 4 protein [Phycisphaerae bacterium]
MKSKKERKVRIAYLLRMYPRFSQTFVVNEILALQAQGVDLRVASLKRPTDGEFHESVARVHGKVSYFPEFVLSEFGRFRQAIWTRLRRSPGTLLGAAWKTLRHAGATWIDLFQAAYLLRWVKKHGIDHVHVHFGTNEATVAWLAHQLGGLSYSMTLHAFDIFRDNVDRKLLARKINDSQFSVTVTEFNARFLKHEIPGVRPEKIRVAYNGIDLSRFSTMDTSREPGLIFAVGRLIEKKGFIHLIRATARLRDSGEEIRCVIAGDGAEHEQLRREIRRLGLEKVVELAGSMEQDAVARMMRRASVFALPCVEARDGNVDALPTVLLESLASGCPSVSTHVSGVPEIIEDGVSGLLVPPHDDEALAGAIARILDDATLASRLSLAGRRRAETRFDLEANAGVLRRWLLASGSHCRRSTSDSRETGTHTTGEIRAGAIV